MGGRRNHDTALAWHDVSEPIKPDEGISLYVKLRSGHNRMAYRDGRFFRCIYTKQHVQGVKRWAYFPMGGWS